MNRWQANQVPIVAHCHKTLVCQRCPSRQVLKLGVGCSSTRWLLNMRLRSLRRLEEMELIRERDELMLERDAEAAARRD